MLSLVPHPQDDAYDDYQADLQWLKDHNLKWTGKRRPAATPYGLKTYSWTAFSMTDDADPSKTLEVKVGDYVNEANCSVARCPGDAGANSIAKILDILEDELGHCWVCLHYFWRYGQIHARADVRGEEHNLPRLGATRHSAELFLQAEVTLDTFYDDSVYDNASYENNAVRGPHGTFREVRSAASLDGTVTVLPLRDVLARYPDKSQQEALAAYEQGHAQHVEKDPGVKGPGARSNFFFWRFKFDHTSYRFTADHEACGLSGAPARLIPEQLLMADIFCGAGHFAVGARSAGWAVRYGVDLDRDAIGSFRLNTADTLDARFNPQGFGPTDTRHSTVSQLLEDISQGRGPPPVSYMHFSPPCQNLSRAKKLKERCFTGATLMEVVRLVEMVDPTFVTLEEVPGFIIHRFPASGMLLWQEAKKQRQQQKVQLERLRQRRLQQQQQQQQDLSSAAVSESFMGSGDDECDEAEGEGDDSISSDSDDPEDLQGVAEAMAAASVNPDKAKDGQVVFHPFTLVVGELLSLGYQVSLCLLHAAQFGVPQGRWRVKLYAAKVGYKLPMPPTPRYELPAGTRRVFCDSGSENDKEAKQIDHTFLPKGDGAATWWDVLRAAPNAVSPEEGQLFPHITIAEALGDLPTLLTSRSELGSQQQLSGNSSNSSGAASRVAQQQRQQSQQGHQAGMPAEGSLQQQLNALRALGRAAAAAALQRRSGRQAHRFGLDVEHYNPQRGVLLSLLPAAVADLAPASVYAQYARTRHWPEQSLRSFNPGLLLGHAYTGPTTNLPVSGDKVMQPLGVVGTVCGKNTLCRGSVHFAESRMLSWLERRRAQGIPDWFQYEGSLQSREQQVGNAVPYLLCAEVAASVYEAATGVSGRRPPPLIGPSLDGFGLSAAELQRYRAWLRVTTWPEVVLRSRAELARQLGPKSKAEKRLLVDLQDVADDAAVAVNAKPALAAESAAGNN